MIRKTLLTLALAAPLWAAQPVISATGAPVGGEAHAQVPTQSFNFFDPNSWMTGAPVAPMGMPGMPMGGQLNLAHPAGWAVFMRPSTYAQFMNPATYGQFMNPQFYMQFANPNNWMAWMNPASYAAYMNPANYMAAMNPAEYMAFMNPASYMAFMNPASYAVFMNPNTYMQWMNPAAYTVPASTAGGQAFNFMDPNAWAKLWTPEGGQGGVFNPMDPSTWMPKPAEPSKAEGQTQ